MAIVRLFLALYQHQLALPFSRQNKSTKDWLQSKCKLNSVDNICKQSMIDNNKIAYFHQQREYISRPSHRHDAIKQLRMHYNTLKYNVFMSFIRCVCVCVYVNVCFFSSVCCILTRLIIVVVFLCVFSSTNERMVKMSRGRICWRPLYVCKRYKLQFSIEFDAIQRKAV